MSISKLHLAFKAFDEYNSQDPNLTEVEKQSFPENLIYAQRMTDRLMKFQSDASETLQLAARSQHIGRWEIPRSEFPMDRKGYLKWRSQLKIHHASIADGLLSKLDYDVKIIDEVKDLLMKKALKQNPETQALEDVICLVFLEHYFDDFASKHDDAKLVNILKKTLTKMSQKGINAALELPLSEKAKNLIARASNS